MFGLGINEAVSAAKKLITAILRWIWDKIKDWIMAHLPAVIIAVLVLLVVGLVKLLLFKLQITPVLKDLGVMA